jgi:NADPH:quinone reductase-like Zn-dependent oxidoreductase
VIATASPRSSDSARAAGADEIIDYTSTSVPAAVSPSLDVVLNLAPISRAELGELAGLIRSGGVVLSTVPSAMPEDTGDVRAVAVFVRSDAPQLSQLVALIDAGELHVDIAERHPLSELPAVHARADAGELHGKVVLLPAAA